MLVAGCLRTRPPTNRPGACGQSGTALHCNPRTVTFSFPGGAGRSLERAGLSERLFPGQTKTDGSSANGETPCPAPAQSATWALKHTSKRAKDAYLQHAMQGLGEHRPRSNHLALRLPSPHQKAGSTSSRPLARVRAGRGLTRRPADSTKRKGDVLFPRKITQGISRSRPVFEVQMMYSWSE